MSGGSSLKDTDFSNDTDLSGIDVDEKRIIRDLVPGALVKARSHCARLGEYRAALEVLVNRSNCPSRICRADEARRARAVGPRLKAVERARGKSVKLKRCAKVSRRDQGWGRVPS